jgi:hypothetical protein
MKWIEWILAYVFDCVHRHTTWARCDRRGLDYVCCFDCGRQLPYSTRRMSIVTIEEQVEDRTFDGRDEFRNGEWRVVAGFSQERVRSL